MAAVKNELTAEMTEDILTAIRMRINYIETRTTTHSAADAESFNASLKLNPDKLRDRQCMIRICALSKEQRDLISRLEDGSAILKSRSKK